MGSRKNNYRNGRQKEYRIMKKERAKGIKYVIRSAGSHSPIDIISIDVNERVIRFIQCKPKSMGEAARQRLLDENNLLNGGFQARFEVR